MSPLITTPLDVQINIQQASAPAVAPVVSEQTIAPAPIEDPTHDTSPEALAIEDAESAEAAANDVHMDDVIVPEPPADIFDVDVVLSADGALNTIRLGIPVAPVKGGEKYPPIPDFPNVATTDIAKVTAWIRERPTCNWLSLATPDGVCFIDEDQSARLHSLYEEKYGEPYPRTRTTQSQNDHRQSAWKQTDRTRALGNQAQRSFLDGMMSFRQDGQYCMCQGSHLNPGPENGPTPREYVLVDDSPIAIMPDKLMDLIESLLVKEKTKKTRTRKSKMSINGVPVEPPPPDPGFKALFEAVGWTPLVDRLNKHVDERYHEFKLGANEKNTYCPIPSHGKQDANMPYRVCFGVMADEPAVLHCFGCGWTGDMVMACHEVDGLDENMYHTARRICVEQNLRFEEFFPASKPKPETDRAKPQPTPEEKATAKAKMDNFFYDPAEDVAPRVWIHTGFDAMKCRVIWVGTEKAEKSLFALRKAMHEAAGKDWLNYPSNGPIVVAYFDAENPTEDIDDRYNALMEEFTGQEQILIRKNLSIFKGREWLEKNEGSNFLYTNEVFWADYADECKARGTVSYYFDCLYQFHNLEAKNNEGLKTVVERLHKYVGLETSFKMLHHTHKESDENMGKPKRTALRYIGARSWSNKIYGGGHVKKMADVIVCQERFEERDGSTVLENFIDFASYSRIAMDSILMSFEDDAEEKYLRHLVVSLSMHSQNALDELKMKGGGPWASRFEAAKCLSVSKRIGYKLLNDLISKGYLISGKDGCLVVRSGAGEAAKQADLRSAAQATEEHSRSAKKWLRGFLKDGPVSITTIKAAVKGNGFEWESIQKNKKRDGIVSEIGADGGIRWRLT